VISRLGELGVGKGDVVCLILKRSGAFLPTLLGCVETGAVLAPTNPDPHDVEAALRALVPRLVIATEDGSPPPGSLPIGAQALTLAEFLGPDPTTGPGLWPDGRTQPHREPALLVRTSGTTGDAKFVELSELNLAWNSQGLATRYGCSPLDRFLCTLPYHHMNAIMMNGCVTLTAGACTEFVNLVRSPEPLAALRGTNATIASLTPTLLRFLMDAAAPADTLGGLRFALCGAAPLPGSLWRAFEERFKVPVYQGYGLTETTCWAASTVPGVPHDYENVGYPFDCQVLLDTGWSGEVATWLGLPGDPARKQVGEILIAGPLVMCGYRHADGRRTSGLTSRGSLRTGDLGLIEPDGLVRVVGRRKEIIIRGGVNLVPEAIDAVLRTQPAVADCKTVGVADEQFGERVVTAYVAAAGAAPTRAELRRFLVERLSNESLPDEIVPVTRLPRTAVGKVALADLRNLVSGAWARDIFAAVNRSKNKRAKTPDPEGVVRAFQARLLADEPLGFLVYWGAGRRAELAQVDTDALARLHRFISAAQTVPGVRVKLDVLLMEVHARINGKPGDRVWRYHSAVRRACEELGFHCTVESDLWRSAGLDIERIHAEAAATTEAALRARFEIEEECFDRLRAACQRHAEGLDPEQALKSYVLACAAEGETVAERFRGSVFLTSSPPSLAFLNPKLPTLFIFSYRHGSTEKPWFVDEVSSRCVPASYEEAE
jgi:acyl-CoA synthetase (AMP-forming)/AMP-acid ligase II